jgi:hypothetical protein
MQRTERSGKQTFALLFNSGIVQHCYLYYHDTSMLALAARLRVLVYALE